MKICWFGIYRSEYPRNNIFLRGLRERGVEIIECHEKSDDPWRYLKLAWRLFKLHNNYDLLYGAHPAPVPTILGRIVSRRPVVMEAFYSMYDAVVDDRKETSPYNPRALKLKFLDWLAAFLADRLIVDTEAHKRYWGAWRGVGEKKIRVVYIGANDEIFKPVPELIKDRAADFLVSFHGSYIPLQGVPKIIDAITILRHEPNLRFRLIGSGQDFAQTLKTINERELTAIEIIPRVPGTEVPKYLQEADIILGIFGDSDKAHRVIPNKVYEGLALRKAVITMDSPAIHEVFAGDELLIIPNTAEALAEAIQHLRAGRSLRERLAERGYQKFLAEFTPDKLAAVLESHLIELLTS